MIAIIGAMEEEVAAVKEFMIVEKQSFLLALPYYIGTIEGKSVILIQGGIGKVNTATYLTMLLTKYEEIDIVINVGSAGGLDDNQSVGDVVIATEVAHHDVDVSAFNYEIGHVPGFDNKTFSCDEELVKIANEIIKDIGVNAHVGLIVSGDQFINSGEQVSKIKINFSKAKCGEMEAATIGQVCHLFNKRFIITRSLSDVFGKGDSDIQFDEYLEKASSSSAKLCQQLICKL